MRNGSARRVAVSGLLTSLMLVLGLIERQFPLTAAIPGIKLGLANSVLIYALYMLGVKQSIVLMLLKAMMSWLIYTNMQAMFYSLAGGVLSLLAMIALSRIKGVSVIGVSALGAANLADSIEANNAAALAGEPDEFGRRNCPYIETRDGLWAIRVDPTFYLTTAGLAIDTDCHVLNEEKKAIPGLYAAGDVCGSIEEKDAKQYGMGFDAALTYGYIMGETLKKEI